MDLTKELYFKENDATTVAEVKALFERMLDVTWTIDIYRNKEARTFNLRELGWKIDYNNAKRSAGICQWSWKVNPLGNREPQTKRVKISMYLLTQNLEEGKASEWEETIRHELAHAVDVEFRNKSNHDRIWTAIAKEMLSSGRVTFTSDDLKDDKESKYTLICDGCGVEKKSHKKKKRLSACGKCCREHNGGRYSLDYVLRQVQNY